MLLQVVLLKIIVLIYPEFQLKNHFNLQFEVNEILLLIYFVLNYIYFQVYHNNNQRTSSSQTSKIINATF